jgi:hypothetical protein
LPFDEEEEKKVKQTSGSVSKYQTAQHARLSVSVEVETAFIDEQTKRVSQSVVVIVSAQANMFFVTRREKKKTEASVPAV